jgi:hypothetical protein
MFGMLGAGRLLDKFGAHRLSHRNHGLESWPP